MLVWNLLGCLNFLLFSICCSLLFSFDNFVFYVGYAVFAKREKRFCCHCCCVLWVAISL